MQIRRVVTGHTPDGKAYIASDSKVNGIKVDLLPGWEFQNLWGADEVLTFPDDGMPHPFSTYFPPVGGFRFGLFTIPAESEMKSDEIDMEAALVQMEDKLPGMLTHLEPDNPGMHTTNTIDFEYVISGEIWLELDDGKEVHLKPGDTVVQNGTRHAWRNRGSEPCQMVVCLIGIYRDKS